MSKDLCLFRHFRNSYQWLAPEITFFRPCANEPGGPVKTPVSGTGGRKRKKVVAIWQYENSPRELPIWHLIFHDNRGPEGRIFRLFVRCGPAPRLHRLTHEANDKGQNTNQNQCNKIQYCNTHVEYWMIVDDGFG